MEPDWPLLAAQLVRQPGYASSATIRTTAALAHVQIEQLCTALQNPGRVRPASDGSRPLLFDRVLEFRPDTARIEFTQWPPHPLCECRPRAEHEGPSSILDGERML